MPGRVMTQVLGVFRLGVFRLAEWAGPQARSVAPPMGVALLVGVVPLMVTVPLVSSVKPGPVERVADLAQFALGPLVAQRAALPGQVAVPAGDP
jgi:hypothetical protein